MSRKSKQDYLVQLVNEATSPLLTEPNWDANMRVVDACRAVTSPLRLSVLVTTVRKKLLVKQHKVVMFALTLVECLIKNGSAEVHLAFSNEKFMGTMVKLVKAGKKQTRVREQHKHSNLWG